VDKAKLNQHEETLRRADRRALLLATSLGFLLFLAAVLGLPRLANLPVGSYSIVAHAYSRH